MERHIYPWPLPQNDLGTVQLLLLDKGAGMTFIHQECNGMTALDYTLASNDHEIVYLLVKAGAQNGSISNENLLFRTRDNPPPPRGAKRKFNSLD